MSSVSRVSYGDEWSGATVSKMFRAIPAPVVIGGSLALIYFFTLTANYFWDGITFASYIERAANGHGRVDLLFHQNHLLYDPIGFVLYLVARAAGLTLRALTVLQLANVVFGSVALALFFQIAERMMHRHAAVLCSMALGLSALWWKLSTDADSYVLAMLLILLCFKNLLSPTPRWYQAGLALAGALLIHEMASLFFPAAILAVFSRKDIRHKLLFASQMGGLAWSIAIVVYYACGATLHHMINPLQVVKWAVSNPTQFTPSLNPIPGILIIPRKNIEAFIGHDFVQFYNRPGILSAIVASAAIIGALALVIKASRTVGLLRLANSVRSRGRLSELWGTSAPSLVAWIIPYVVFLIFWEPEDFYYPVFYMPALVLLIGLLLNRYHLRAASSGERLPAKDMPTGTGALAVVTLALFNLAFFIIPNMRTDSNSLITAARAAREVWNEQTVIYFANHTEADTTFEYFNNYTVWHRVSRGSLAEIESQIELTARKGSSVWLSRGAQDLMDREWLARHATGKKIALEVKGTAALYAEVSPDR